MRLWDYALATYARPGVEAACLVLQDDHDQCAPLLLWRLWTLDEHRAVDDSLLDLATSAARAWDEAAVAPLRQIRRDLKRSFPPMSDADRAALRDEVKGAELRAERLLLETLEALATAEGGQDVPPLQALEAAARAWGRPAPAHALLELVRAAI